MQLHSCKFTMIPKTDTANKTNNADYIECMQMRNMNSYMHAVNDK